MGQRWIIDVLADLENFATQNGLPLVADRMREAAIVASAEIAAAPEKVTDRTNGDQNDPTILSGSA
ncbi:hypothetical protein [Loktanella sp. SALINAS62]|uniref:hypothetical protein n=1 Tax=Loktanella sp. SALINAS62 TaxID=2706124 RepID=UPI001B8AFDDF|nr:hypothetical protein [Loktanella sp. SALINAS62]MBS1301341.1 hypothetical protein [Loktanella sp. SALINAS62]